MIQSIKLKIQDMDCTSCAMNIDGELEDTEGVVESSTSYAKHLTEVKFDSDKINPNSIISIIQKVGYGAEVETKE